MKVQSLRIVGFKNLSGVALEPASRINGFWGSNGQGKSNLLEALYATLKGRSFRPYSGRADWVPATLSTPLAVFAALEDQSGHRYECSMRIEADGKLSHFLNEKRTLAWRLAEKMPVVVFSPDDHSLVRESPEHRREFLDEVFADVCPGYAEVHSRFEKALKSRNRVLKMLLQAENRGVSSELDTWTTVLAQAAVELCDLKAEVWPAFREEFLQVTRELFEGTETVTGVDFEGSRPPTGSKATDFIELFRMNEAVDRATGWTHKGPQRDDFRMHLDGLDSRTKSSQGQARLLALALRWSHARWVQRERGEIPLFLIDDFSNELDGLRRRKLLEILSGIPGQVFITGTDPNNVDQSHFASDRHYSVDRGTVTAKSKL